MKGWKNFNKDMKCRSFQFEVGKTYEVEGKLKMCSNGFHYHASPIDLFKYYDKNLENIIVCEVMVHGEVLNDDDKSCTNKIEIGRKLSIDEVKAICKLENNTGWHNSGDSNSGYRNSGDSNSGDRNSGYRNSGNRNSGDWNSGYRNSGDSNSGDRNSGYRNSGNRNSGDWNSGDSNSGYRNSGYRNSGDRNSGDRNSGYRNSGNRNSGDWNSGDWNKSNYSTGNFNTVTPDEIIVFNKPCKRDIWDSANKPDFIYFDLTEWINESSMSDQDKKDHPEYFCQQGYLKSIGYKEAWKKAWDNKGEDDLELLEALPNFNWAIFTEISGIVK